MFGEKDFDLFLVFFNGSFLGENDLFLDLGLVFCFGGGDFFFCFDWDGDLFYRWGVKDRLRLRRRGEKDFGEKDLFFFGERFFFGRYNFLGVLDFDLFLYFSYGDSGFL